MSHSEEVDAVIERVKGRSRRESWWELHQDRALLADEVVRLRELLATSQGMVNAAIWREPEVPL